MIQHIPPLAFRLSALLVLVLLLLGGGCGRPQAAAPVEIRSSFWGMVQDRQVWEELAKRFNARQKHIHVRLEHITGQNYHSKLFAMTVGRCAPDVMASDDEPYRFLADNNVYEDLTPYVAREPEFGRSAYY